MEQDLQQLEVALVTAHERLTQATDEVESLEGMKDYLLLGDKTPQASQTAKIQEARKDKQMILFNDEDSNRNLAVSQEEIDVIKRHLTDIQSRSLAIDEVLERVKEQEDKVNV